MKKFLNTVLAILFAVSVVGVMACDDGEDNDNNTPADVTATEDVAATVDVTETPEDVTAVEEVVEPAGACTNEADDTLLATEELRDAVTASATDCGIGCLGEDDVGACSVACLVDATGLSSECSTCYAGMVNCSKDNCLAKCLADPSKIGRASCRERV